MEFTIWWTSVTTKLWRSSGLLEPAVKVCSLLHSDCEYERPLPRGKECLPYNRVTKAVVTSFVKSPETTCRSMHGENWPLVTNELVEFEKSPVEVQDFRKITNHSRGIYWTYLWLMKENQKMSTCKWSDMETLGSWLIMFKKNSLDIAADITKYVENKSPILNVVCGHKECGHKERELSHTSTPLIHPIWKLDHPRIGLWPMQPQMTWSRKSGLGSLKLIPM